MAVQLAENQDADVVTGHDVFISYRRSTGLDLARSIAYWFSMMGTDCFIDQTELLSGKFDEQLKDAVSRTQYVLLLLSESALDRCSDPEDWVRREIELARSLGKTIIPVTPLAQVTYPNDLPASLQFLPLLETSKIDREKNFESSLRQMVRNQMPLLDAQMEERHQYQAGEINLIKLIRWFKKTDGIIDDDERRKLDAQAASSNISPTRLAQLIDRVDEEESLSRERLFVKEALIFLRGQAQTGGLVEGDSRDALVRLADERGIDPARRMALLSEISVAWDVQRDAIARRVASGRSPLRHLSWALNVLLLGGLAFFAYQTFRVVAREKEGTATLRTSLKEKSDRLEQANGQLTKLKTEQDETEQKLSAAYVQLAAISNELVHAASAGGRLAVAETDLKALSKRLADEQSICLLATNQVAELEAKVKDMQAQRTRLEELQQRFTALDAEKQRLEAEKQGLTTEKARLETANQGLRSEKSDLEKKVKEQDETIRQLRRRLNDDYVL